MTKRTHENETMAPNTLYAVIFPLYPKRTRRFTKLRAAKVFLKYYADKQSPGHEPYIVTYIVFEKAPIITLDDVLQEYKK